MALIRNTAICLLICLPLCKSALTQNKVDSAFTTWLNAKLKDHQTAGDAQLAIQYRNDTSGFTAYPRTPFYDSVHPSGAALRWEVNTCDARQSKYTNLYRSYHSAQPLNDTMVLTKSNGGFGTICPPGYCFWYISEERQNGTCTTIATVDSVRRFLGQIDNAYKAYVWLSFFPYQDSRLVPFTIFYEACSYKKTVDGYLVIIHLRVNDCPITHANLLYHVRRDNNVSFIKILKVFTEGGCI